MALGSYYGDSEQSNPNQYSFGPSSYSYDPSTYSGNTGVTGGITNPGTPGAYIDPNTGNTSSIGSLPWQMNNTQPSSPTYQNVGHDGTYNGMNREQWRDAWMSSGVKDPAATDAWLTSMGAKKIGDNGTYYTPFGEGLDLGIGYKTGSVMPGWTDVGLGTYGSSPVAQASGFSALGNQFAPSPSIQQAITSSGGNANGLLAALQQIFGGMRTQGGLSVGNSPIFNNALLSAVGNDKDRMSIDSFLNRPIGLQKPEQQFAPVLG
jgi:hypothetical protein